MYVFFKLFYICVKEHLNILVDSGKPGQTDIPSVFNQSAPRKTSGVLGLAALQTAANHASASVVTLSSPAVFSFQYFRFDLRKNLNFPQIICCCKERGGNIKPGIYFRKY